MGYWFSITPGFAAAQKSGFLVLSSNGRADSLCNQVLPFQFIVKKSHFWGTLDLDTDLDLDRVALETHETVGRWYLSLFLPDVGRFILLAEADRDLFLLFGPGDLSTKYIEKRN